MQLFYSKNIQGNSITLDPIDSKHCCKVLRKRKGDSVQVVDGLGNLHECIIELDNLKACELSIKATRTNFGKRKQNLHIAIAPTKKLDRIEWFVEKAVEIGIETISFIQTRYTEKTNLKLERIEKIAIAAMKQSGRAKLPTLNDIQSLNNFLEQHKSIETQKFVAFVPENGLHLKNAYAGKNTIILIGPEGGFSVDEIETCVKFGYQAVSLGDFRLRTETAGVVASSIVAGID